MDDDLILNISIHALLAESDNNAACFALPEMIISIHALLAESDNRPLRRFLNMSLFLSTLSLRRATTGCAKTGSLK